MYGDAAERTVDQYAQYGMTDNTRLGFEDQRQDRTVDQYAQYGMADNFRLGAEDHQQQAMPTVPEAYEAPQRVHLDSVPFSSVSHAFPDQYQPVVHSSMPAYLQGANDRQEMAVLSSLPANHGQRHPDEAADYELARQWHSHEVARSQPPMGSQETPAAIRENFHRILQARGPLSNFPQGGDDGPSLPSSGEQPQVPKTAEVYGSFPAQPMATPASFRPAEIYRPAEQRTVHATSYAPSVAGWQSGSKAAIMTSSTTSLQQSAPQFYYSTADLLPSKPTQELIQLQTALMAAEARSDGVVAAAERKIQASQAAAQAAEQRAQTAEAARAAEFYYSTADLLPSKPTQDIFYGEMSLMRMFPYIFTFCCVMAFMVPIWLTVHLGEDRNVQFFLGSYNRYAMLLPLVFVVGHMWHIQRRQPYKPAVLLCLLVPSIVLMALNDATMTVASDMADQLFSTDCDTFKEKRDLQRAWDAAYELYANCLQDTVKLTPASKNLTMEDAIANYRIQDCAEYSNHHYANKKEWEYLWYLEEEHECAGWCNFGHQIWSFHKEPRDSCSNAASQVFFGKVGRISQQVLLYSVLVLVTTSVSLIGAGPMLRSRGIDW